MHESRREFIKLDSDERLSGDKPEILFQPDHMYLVIKYISTRTMPGVVLESCMA